MGDISYCALKLRVRYWQNKCTRTQVYDVKLLRHEYLQRGGVVIASRITSLSLHVYEVLIIRKVDYSFGGHPVECVWVVAPASIADAEAGG